MVKNQPHTLKYSPELQKGIFHISSITNQIYESLA